ncbi:MAG: D-alanyl-D-alanine carboxypeptidase [Chlamydiia bacterium]|nr:D-alanyl-D-alanine carboxypeptidase [Chlamydiia bacterium]
MMNMIMQILSSMLLLSAVVYAKLPVRVESKAAILMNADTGAVLYEKNKDQRAYPASITKIATALYALKHLDDLDKVVLCPSECLVRISPKVKEDHHFTHPPHWLEWDGTSYGVRKGEILPLDALFHGMMLISGNDASNVIAHHIAGNVQSFSQQMTAFCKELGCKSTEFRNPHGLHHHEHYTTAHDMALITQEALKDPRFRKIVSTLTHQRPNTNKQKSKTITQANRLLKKMTKFYYSKAFGIKIGYHKRAGYTLVAAAEHQGRVLIAVILGSPNPVQRYRDAIGLFDAAFAEKKQKRILFRASENVFRHTVSGAHKSLMAKLEDDIYFEYYPSEEPELKSCLHWDLPALPIHKDAVVGELIVSDESG